MRNRIYLSFTITDYEDITHEDISLALAMKPFKVFVKGEKRHPDSTIPNPVLWQFNRWVMESPLDEFSSFKDQMNATLDIIEAKIDLFRPFCERYTCGFSCAVEIYYNNGESTPSIRLGSRYNKLVKELDLDIDIDLYNFSNEVR